MPDHILAGIRYAITLSYFYQHSVKLPHYCSSAFKNLPVWLFVNVINPSGLP